MHDKINDEIEDAIKPENTSTKVLRSGYTTGACAAAVSKAATYLLLCGIAPSESVGSDSDCRDNCCVDNGCSGVSLPVHEQETLAVGENPAAVDSHANRYSHTENPVKVEIPFPDGSRVIFKVNECSINGIDTGRISAIAEIIKDAGDDPDITDKAKISSAAEFVNLDELPETSHGRIEYLETAAGPLGVLINGGAGVGVVTKPGLPVPVGYPAINPVPQKMIKEAVVEVFNGVGGFQECVRKSAIAGFYASRQKSINYNECPADAKVPILKITISVADGEILAKKTLNGRLGIEGGLSILGTTGIVKPVSAEAWKATISASMSVAKAMNMDTIVLSSGRSSEKAHQLRFAFPEESYAMMGDYIEYSLVEAKRNRFANIHVCAQLAKLVKMAMAIPQTHVKYGAIDPKIAAEFIAGIADDEISGLLSNGKSFNTVREIFGKINNNQALLDSICNEAKQYVNEITAALSVTVFLISYDGEIVAKSI